MATVAARGVASGRAGGDVLSGRSDEGVSQREDLANFISMITRDETPFMSTIGKTKATAIYHEWQTDELNAPGYSVVTEGTDYIQPTSNSPVASGGDLTVGDNYFAVTGTNRTRLGNYTQINGKSIAISGTRRAIDQAGVADEYAYQLKKRGTELRRDLEYSLIHSYQVSGQAAAGSGAAAPGGAGGSARLFGGIQSWINDPDLVAYAGSGHTATTGSNSGLGTTVPGLAAAGTGTTRGALSLSDIDQVMQNIYEEGGKANKIMLSPKLRRDFSDLMVTDSGVRRNIDMDGKLRQSVDIYMSDFGDLMVMPNYIMGLQTSAGTGVNEHKDSMALIYDPMWFSVATLRPLQEVEVGQRGDSTIGMMVEECTLEVKNPKGCAAIYNLA